MDSPEGRAAYPEGLGECLARLLREAGHAVTLLPMGEQGAEGFSDELLDGADVAFWWGHWYHGAVQEEIVNKVADRVHRGMGMVFLHSAHDSKMFKKLLGTSCSLKWREAGERERLWCVDPAQCANCSRRRAITSRPNSRSQGRFAARMSKSSASSGDLGIVFGYKKGRRACGSPSLL